MSALDADRIGQIRTTTYACTCGDTFTTRSRIVTDTRNPALTTGLDLTFTEFRAFLQEHRPHGDIAAVPAEQDGR